MDAVRRLAGVAAVIAVVVGLAGAGAACTCLQPGPPNASLAAADAVFSGTVEQVETRDGMREALFDVSRVWKGPTTERIAVRTAGSSAACGVNFEPGTDYLVYATGSSTDLTASLCSRTARVTDAEADLDALGAGTAPTAPGVAGRTGQQVSWPLLGLIVVLVAGTVLWYRARRTA